MADPRNRQQAFGSSSESASGPSGESFPPPDDSADATTLLQQDNFKARKRTKTGCLTCRKRRIKCSEERPTCANCNKSKRTCEGYAPRLTFKDPLNSFNPAWANRGTGPYRPLSTATGASGQYPRPQPSPGTSQSQFPIIAPRPVTQNSPHDQYTTVEQAQGTWPAPSHRQYSDHVRSPGLMPAPPDQLPQQGMYTHQLGPLSPSATGPSVYTGHQGMFPPQHFQGHSQGSGGDNMWSHSVTQQGVESHHHATTPLSANFTQTQTMNDAMYVASPAQAQRGDPYHNWDTTQARTYSENVAGSVGQSWQLGPQASASSAYQTSAGHPNYMYVEASAADEPDDDYYDVNSDEEENARGNMTPAAERDVGLMHAISASRIDQSRSYHTWLDRPNLLRSYVPRFSASPLMDPLSARVFCHFITATAPSLSVFERHPINPSVIFSGKPVPKSHQALWTYTIPMLALSNQGLLQSMLALASLQICRLQQTPIIASSKHYHYALRKVAKAVASPTKRSTLATLVATLLLGHYEATAAEHAKWSSHMAGARQLLMEVDFKGTTRQLKEMKARGADQTQMQWYNPYVNAQFRPVANDFPYFPDSDGLDEHIVSQIMGWRIRYDQFGSVTDEQASPKEPLTEKEIESFQNFRDLFWWYAKHDIIQSVISGNQLLLPYDRWIHASPRAPLGKLDAIYGSMDHVVLLLGRVADFSYRDRARKIKVMKANGGHWIPPPGMFKGPPPGAPPGPTPAVPPSAASGPPPTGPPSAAPSPPQFYGMAPTSEEPPRLPQGFASAPRDDIYTPSSPDTNMSVDLAADTTDALAEWAEIQQAFVIVEQSLGPAFESLSKDVATPFETPFGTALQFRTYHIAVIWTWFYTGRLISARTHPSMPPATTMATGIAASQTAEWANTIGRVVMGLQGPKEQEALNPTFGSAMTEMLLSLFFAGVQYVVPAQRNETIARLRLVADRVGVESAALIAAGLERFWIKMWDLGRGPEYKVTMEPTDDEVVVGRKLTVKVVGGGKREGGADRELPLVYVSQEAMRWSGGVLGLDQELDGLALNDDARGGGGSTQGR